MHKPRKRKLDSGEISWIADYKDPISGKRMRPQFKTKREAAQ